LEKELKEYYNNKKTSKIDTGGEQPISDTYRHIQSETGSETHKKFCAAPRALLAAKLLNMSVSSSTATDEHSQIKVTSNESKSLELDEFQTARETNPENANKLHEQNQQENTLHAPQISCKSRDNGETRPVVSELCVATSETVYFTHSVPLGLNNHVQHSKGSTVLSKHSGNQLDELGIKHVSFPTTANFGTTPTWQAFDLGRCGGDRTQTIMENEHVLLQRHVGNGPSNTANSNFFSRTARENFAKSTREVAVHVTKNVDAV